jgi:CheY-like chemotaxis protein
LRERTFDCITLDLSLGEQSGIEILKLLAELRCRTPIIIVSGSEDATCRDGQDRESSRTQSLPADTKADSPCSLAQNAGADR